jgi:hypothetical protein
MKLKNKNKIKKRHFNYLKVSNENRWGSERVMFDIALPPFALVLTKIKGGGLMLDIALPNLT